MRVYRVLAVLVIACVVILTGSKSMDTSVHPARHLVQELSDVGSQRLLGASTTMRQATNSSKRRTLLKLFSFVRSVFKSFKGGIFTSDPTAYRLMPRAESLKNADRLMSKKGSIKKEVKEEEFPGFPLITDPPIKPETPKFGPIKTPPDELPAKPLSTRLRGRTDLSRKQET